MSESDSVRRSTLDPTQVGPLAIPLTQRGILGGALQLCQPAKGYRSAIEPIVLAASCGEVPQKSAAPFRVLDMGCGVGTAGLCLAHRWLEGCPSASPPAFHITGVDRQGCLVDIAHHNAGLNGLTDCFSFIHADLSTLSASHLQRGMFDLVITNPPFYTPQQAGPSPFQSKELGHIESSLDLNAWVHLATKYLAPGGKLIILYVTSRLPDVVTAMATAKLGAIDIYPLWPRIGAPSKRVLLRGVKGRRSPARLLPGLVLHQEREYTPEAHAILWQRASVAW